MEHPPSRESVDRKQMLRTWAVAARSAQWNKDAISRRIVARCLSLTAYDSAETVLWYIDVRAEVRTRYDLPPALKSGKRIVVPWCADVGELRLFQLESMDELIPGRYRILEPRDELKTQSTRHVDSTELDFVMVPGAAFDRCGGRIGHGRGYYDRLLSRTRPDATLVGLAFECQMCDEVPMEPHDVRLDTVVTETATYVGAGRRSNV